MVADLLQQIERRGVWLAVINGRLVALGQPGQLDDLSEQIAVQKTALVQLLLSRPNGQMTPLPPQFRPMIRAATNHGLGGPINTRSGLITQPSDYALACAALYAIGASPEQQLQDLELLREAWIS